MNKQTRYVLWSSFLRKMDFKSSKISKCKSWICWIAGSSIFFIACHREPDFLTAYKSENFFQMIGNSSWNLMHFHNPLWRYLSKDMEFYIFFRNSFRHGNMHDIKRISNFTKNKNLFLHHTENKGQFLS